MEWHLWSGDRSRATRLNASRVDLPRPIGSPSINPRAFRPRMAFDAPVDYVAPPLVDMNTFETADQRQWRRYTSQAKSGSLRDAVQNALPNCDILSFTDEYLLSPMFAVRFLARTKGEHHSSKLWFALPPITFLMDLRNDPSFADNDGVPYAWIQREVYEQTQTVFQGIPPDLLSVNINDIPKPFSVLHAAINDYMGVMKTQGWDEGIYLFDDPIAKDMWGPFVTL